MTIAKVHRGVQILITRYSQNGKGRYNGGCKTTLKVLYGLDNNNQLISPDQALKEENYRCPSCKTNLFFRESVVNIPHFAHANTITCNQETITHKTAKLVIQKVITEWKAGTGKRPSIQRECCICNKKHTLEVPNKVDMVTLEHRLPEGHIVDVALMVEGKAKAAIEVKVTHKVGDEEAERLSISFIEMKGEEIIKNPYEWIPITDKFRESACPNCLVIRKLQMKFNIEYAGLKRVDKNGCITMLK